MYDVYEYIGLWRVTCLQRKNVLYIVLGIVCWSLNPLPTLPTSHVPQGLTFMGCVYSPVCP